RQRWPDGGAVRLAAVAATGFGIALLGVLPVTRELLAWAVSHLPGAGLFRDGPKFLAPYALLLCLGIALGAERLTDRLTAPRARAVLVAAVVLPVALMPDLAFGGAGALRPVSYPADWDRVADLVAADPGEVLSLPLSEYRRYAWNRNRVVIDPAPRYLPADVLGDDRLRVGSLVLAGENPRAARVRELLDRGEPVSRSGVRWVLVQREAGGTVPEGALAGLRESYRGKYLVLYANPDVADVAPSAGATGRRWVLMTMYLFSAGLLTSAFWRLRQRSTAW
ncbi:MAG TPA: hypothetical protein VF163_18370, partial [Micromonosporaceae bacterium]